jgi:hypothetical protein
VKPSVLVDTGFLLSKPSAKSRGGEVASHEWLLDRSRFVASRDVGSLAGRVARLDSSRRKSPLWRADLGLSISNPSRSLSSASFSTVSGIRFSGVIVTGGRSVAEPDDRGLGLLVGERGSVCWKRDSSYMERGQSTAKVQQTWHNIRGSKDLHAG